jgi:predicted NBD/HSP70 family sugar kinase
LTVRFTEALSQQRGDDFAVIDMDGNEVTGAKSVFEKASAGNSIAIAVLEETKEYLAILCINICRVVDPEVIIFGGGMAMAGDALLSDIKKRILQKTWKVLPTDVELRVARAVENGGILGAALAAEQKINSIATTPNSVSFFAASLAGFVAFCLGLAIGYHRNRTSSS